MDSFHRIPENDDRCLRSFLRLGESAPIPQAVLDAYWDFKRIRDPYMCCDVFPEVLAWLVYQTKVDVPKDEPENEAIALVRSGAVPYDADIKVSWKGRYPILAKFRGYNASRDKFMVILPKESAEREFEFDRLVEVPSLVEA